eukprot:TRINITY_DN19451_c0_g1_i1.p1 TRINITY_DN19451_c0_g1~~TRINITY_DN19451_c0_g1_i1.p1  ORF type:complete len:241 (+),score=44.37 TRINITY_DN19451_c0_g1_i1:49-771(+)
MDGEPKISAEEVIAKLKDDGDFDTLRLKIIRKLKENEDLRNSIISVVKQSAALNREGAENLKPRQLSDAIHEEIGSQLMGQISDGLWKIIRSPDGMKNEITATVESVYNKLMNPKGKEVADLPTPNQGSCDKEASVSLTISTSDRDTLSCAELKEPPGLSLSDSPQANRNDIQDKHKESSPHDRQPIEEPKEELRDSRDLSQLSNGGDPRELPPGFSAFEDGEQINVGMDEDPDVPPGFG